MKVPIDSLTTVVDNLVEKPIFIGPSIFIPTVRKFKNCSISLSGFVNQTLFSHQLQVWFLRPKCPTNNSCFCETIQLGNILFWSMYRIRDSPKIQNLLNFCFTEYLNFCFWPTTSLIFSIHIQVENKASVRLKNHYFSASHQFLESPKLPREILYFQFLSVFNSFFNITTHFNSSIRVGIEVFLVAERFSMR